MDRHDSAAPVSSNTPSLQIPFQRWFKFKEAFSPRLILDCVSSMSFKPQTCLDPFGGSGTTALAAQFLGIRPTTIEVNPFLADLIEAKLSKYDPKRLVKDYVEVLKESESRSADLNLENAPKTMIEPGVNGRWIYSKKVAKKILALRRAIESIPSRRNRILLKVTLGSILVGLSNVVVNGKGRKYRREWQSRQKTSHEVETAFSKAFFQVFTDVCLFSDRKGEKFTLLRGDSRGQVIQSEMIDFALFSPPYPNSFDYTDIYNIELWLLGYLNSSLDNRQLRSQTIRSHVQINREYSCNTSNSKTLKRTYQKLCRARKELWNPDIPEMICAYFDDMKEVLEGIKGKLNKQGKVFLAVGNSKYAGVLVDTELIIKEMSLHLGYQRVKSNSIRSMRASAQQGGRKELTETLIELG